MGPNLTNSHPTQCKSSTIQIYINLTGLNLNELVCFPTCYNANWNKTLSVSPGLKRAIAKSSIIVEPLIMLRFLLEHAFRRYSLQQWFSNHCPGAKMARRDFLSGPRHRC